MVHWSPMDELSRLVLWWWRCAIAHYGAVIIIIQVCTCSGPCCASRYFPILPLGVFLTLELGRKDYIVITIRIYQRRKEETSNVGYLMTSVHRRDITMTSYWRKYVRRLKTTMTSTMTKMWLFWYNASTSPFSLCTLQHAPLAMTILILSPQLITRFTATESHHGAVRHCVSTALQTNNY